MRAPVVPVHTGAALHDTAHETDHDVGGVGANRILRRWPSVLEHRAFAVLDALDQVGHHPDTPVGEDGVGAGDFLQRGFIGPEGH